MTIRRTDTEEHHPEWLFGTHPQAIEAQESRGQQQLVGSDLLPTEVTPDVKQVLVDAGVVFHDPRPDDPLFCPVDLPLGWSKRPTEHSMWSELIDKEGNVRATIFYKAAFYDRRAFLTVPSSARGTEPV